MNKSRACLSLSILWCIASTSLLAMERVIEKRFHFVFNHKNLKDSVVESILSNTSCEARSLIASIRNDDKIFTLLHGDPGTGKTAFVQAISQHSKIPLINICVAALAPSDSLYDLFELLVKGNNKCIVLLEDIELLARDAQYQEHLYALQNIIARNKGTLKFIATINGQDPIRPDVSALIQSRIKFSTPSLQYRTSILKVLLNDLGPHCECSDSIKSNAFINRLAYQVGDVDIRILEGVIIRAKSWAYCRYDEMDAATRPAKATLQQSDLWNALSDMRETEQIKHGNRCYRWAKVFFSFLYRVWPIIDTAIHFGLFCFATYRQENFRQRRRAANTQFGEQFSRPVYESIDRNMENLINREQRAFVESYNHAVRTCTVDEATIRRQAQDTVTEVLSRRPHTAGKSCFEIISDKSRRAVDLKVSSPAFNSFPTRADAYN